MRFDLDWLCWVVVCYILCWLYCLRLVALACGDVVVVLGFVIGVGLVVGRFGICV